VREGRSAQGDRGTGRRALDSAAAPVHAAVFAGSVNGDQIRCRGSIDVHPDRDVEGRHDRLLSCNAVSTVFTTARGGNEHQGVGPSSSVDVVPVAALRWSVDGSEDGTEMSLKASASSPTMC
jgi:hypothetical protein